jgi:hypothetical protein
MMTKKEKEKVVRVARAWARKMQAITTNRSKKVSEKVVQRTDK